MASALRSHLSSIAGELHKRKELVASTFELAKLMQDKESISWLVSNWGADLIRRAVWYRDSSTIREILESGFDVNSTNNNGQTPLDIATRLKRNQLISIM